MLVTAAIFCIVIGIIHSYLGERFILGMLFKHGKVHKLWFAFLSTKGKHLSWSIFWPIAVLCFMSVE